MANEKNDQEDLNIETAFPKAAPPDKIFEPKKLNGGVKGVDSRWDLSDKKIKKVWDKLCRSIVDHGFLAGVIAMKLPEDVTLQGKEYKEGDWIAIDVNGRLKAVKFLLTRGYILNKYNKEMKGKLPIIDVTHTILKPDEKVNEEIFFKLWQRLVLLNTNKMDWDDYDFISSGSKVILEKVQKQIWVYLLKKMDDYGVSVNGKHNGLTDKNILSACIGSLNDKAKTEAKIDFDVRFMDYSDAILDSIVEIKKAWLKGGEIAMKAPWTTALANYFRKSVYVSCFEAQDYDEDTMKSIDNSNRDCFDFAKHGDTYSPKHFDQFKVLLSYLTKEFREMDTPKGGFATTTGPAEKQIQMRIIRSQKKFDRIQMSKAS
jgi:hypothetical protein